MEFKGSLPCSQEPEIKPCTESDEYNQDQF